MHSPPREGILFVAACAWLRQGSAPVPTRLPYPASGAPGANQGNDTAALPGQRSPRRIWMNPSPRIIVIWYISFCIMRARVAELADARDLGSRALGRKGSSPFPRTPKRGQVGSGRSEAPAHCPVAMPEFDDRGVPAFGSCSDDRYRLSPCPSNGDGPPDRVVKRKGAVSWLRRQWSVPRRRKTYEFCASR